MLLPTWHEKSSTAESPSQLCREYMLGIFCTLWNLKTASNPRMAKINAIRASVACSTFQGSLEPTWEKGKRYTKAATGGKGGNHQSQMKHFSLSPLTQQKERKRTEKLDFFSRLPAPYKITMPVTMRTGCQLNILREPSQAKPPSQCWLQYIVSPKHKIARFPTRIEYGRNGTVGISGLLGSTPEKIK